MDVPDAPPPRYNLYESRYGVDNSQYFYYFARAPTKQDDKLILEDLDADVVIPVGNTTFLACVIVKKEHYVTTRKRGKLALADDFDICSPIWTYERNNPSEQFARKEFGSGWRKTHKIMYFNIQLEGHVPWY
jgi:hypothetical protein